VACCALWLAMTKANRIRESTEVYALEECMPRIVAIHGIAQQHKGEQTLKGYWLPALQDGLMRSQSGQTLVDDDFAVAFYGDLFRTSDGPAEKSGSIDFPWEPEDIAADDELEVGLLASWWQEAQRIDPNVPEPELGGKARTPQFVQEALVALSHSKFFAGLAERVMIGNLKQVGGYLRDDAVRATAQRRLASFVDEDTQVLIAHSLGSIVAYETLCAHPDWNIRSFITLGSPLGIPNVIFHRLRPAPPNGKGAWPSCVTEWFNIADRGDVVALIKRLGPLFNGDVQDLLVNNGAKAHDVRPYLTSMQAGNAVAAGLRTQAN
jgi:hypothetical protein